MSHKVFFPVLLAVLLLTATGRAANLLSPACATFETEDMPAEVVCAWNAGAVRLTDQESYRGEKSLELTYGDATKLFGVFLPAAGGPFKAGETYTCSLYVKVEKPCNPQIWAVATKEKSFDNLPWSKYSLKRLMPGAWHQMQATVTMAEDSPCLYCHIAVYGGYDGKIWIDEAKIEPGAEATGEVPGRIVPDISQFPKESFPIDTLSPQGLDDNAWQSIPARPFGYAT